MAEENFTTEQTEATTEVLQSDKMRNTRIGKLLLTMSLPAIISMLVQAMYNIVDSLFLTGINYQVSGYEVQNIGSDSFFAVSIVMPMTMLVVAVAIGIGVGANAYIARKLGEGNKENATKCAKTAIVMSLCAWALMIILAFTVSRPFVSAFVTPDDEVNAQYVIDQGTLYLTIYLACSGGVIIDIVCARILQATGNMKIPMISQLAGALTNIALDALFIMAFKMGVLGAILAGYWSMACRRHRYSGIHIQKARRIHFAERFQTKQALFFAHSKNRRACVDYERYGIGNYYNNERPVERVR